MTIERFNSLSETEKVELIFDANKITEKVDNEANYQLFQIDSFFVESKTSVEGKFKRCFTTFTIKNLPVEYAGQLLSIPLVIANERPKTYEMKRFESKRNELFYVGHR